MMLAGDSALQGMEESKLQDEQSSMMNVTTKDEANMTDFGSDVEGNKKISWRQLFIISSVLISAYLLNGEHAHSVCNICTTLPAAFFTYKQLADHVTRIFAYKATLFYWTIHGILIAFDSLFYDSYGYFFGKFILLVILFFNVVYQYDVAKNLIEQQRQNSFGTGSVSSSGLPIVFSNSPFGLLNSPPGSQIGLNTALTMTDATQNSIRSSYPIKPSTPTSLKTAFSFTRSPELTAYSDVSYSHDGSLKTIVSNEEQYYLGTNDQLSSTASSEISNSEEASESVANETAKSILHADYEKSGDQAGGSLRSSGFFIMDSKEEDLIIEPTDFYPFTDPITICVTNGHSYNVLWALKTNASNRVIAQPVCGFLNKGATVHIKIGVIEVPSEESYINDRIAVDYCLVDDSTVAFDRLILYKTKGPLRRRKKLNIYYEN